MSIPTYGIGDFQDFKAEDMPKLFEFLKQDGKFKSENFNGDISFNNYAYWLGLCNLNDSDFKRAYISFSLAIAFAKSKKLDELQVRCELAAANVLLLLSYSNNEYGDVTNVLIGFYGTAYKHNLEDGLRGLAIAYSMSKNYKSADEILTKFMTMPLTRRRAATLLFCSLVLNEPKYFLHVIKEFDKQEVSYDSTLMNNLAVGYMKFKNSGIKDAEKKAINFWDILDDYRSGKTHEKTFMNPLVISIPVHGKTNPLELSRDERRMVARLHIVSIGWANPEIDPVPENDDLFVKKTKKAKETETKH